MSNQAIVLNIGLQVNLWTASKFDSNQKLDVWLGDSFIGSTDVYYLLSSNSMILKFDWGIIHTQRFNYLAEDQVSRLSRALAVIVFTTDLYLLQRGNDVGYCPLHPAIPSSLPTTYLTSLIIEDPHFVQYT